MTLQGTAVVTWRVQDSRTSPGRGWGPRNPPGSTCRLDTATLRLDGTCIALAEAWRGAAQGVRNAIVFVVSTGVGGGIVSDGRLVAGGSGNAGHLGQMIVADIQGEPAASTGRFEFHSGHVKVWPWSALVWRS